MFFVIKTCNETKKLEQKSVCYFLPFMHMFSVHSSVCVESVGGVHEPCPTLPPTHSRCFVRIPCLHSLFPSTHEAHDPQLPHCGSTMVNRNCFGGCFGFQDFNIQAGSEIQPTRLSWSEDMKVSVKLTISQQLKT